MSSTSTSEGCLSSDALAAWAEGKLDDEARRHALSHASRCAVCREASSLLAALHPVDVAGASQLETPADGADDDRAAVPELGSYLGRFRVEKVIGKGGMALVLRARDERLDRDVAIKLAHASVAKSEALAARLASEARALAALTHPNLVTVYEAGEHAGRAYLVMELVDGENLRAHVATKRPSWRAGLAQCLAAGRGLAALHAAGFVHRDVKPDNVLIAGDGRVLLADLGLAKRLDSGPKAAGASEKAPLTRTGAVVGTPRYLAPERVAGQPGDVRSDVYAFAAMTLEIVRGCEGDVPRRVVALLSKGLDPDPAMRFGSIDELSRSASAASRSRRRPAALAGGVLVALAAIAAVAAARGRASESGSSRTPTQSEPDRASGSAPGAPVEFTTGSAEPPLPFAAAEPSALPSADASPSASSAPRTTPALAAPVASPIAQPLPLAPALAKTGSSAPVDPLAPCRALVDLYCNPALVDDVHCAWARGHLRAVQSHPVDERALDALNCQHKLASVTKEVNERLDRLNGRPTTHLGNVSDEVLDARFPGCARYRRTNCGHPNEHSLMCQNIIRYIDRAFTGALTEQNTLRMMCDREAAQELDDKRELAKRRDGGAPSAIVSPEGAP